jgi:hypothetical protein
VRRPRRTAQPAPFITERSNFDGEVFTMSMEFQLLDGLAAVLWLYLGATQGTER